VEFAHTISFSGRSITWTPLTLALLLFGMAVMFSGPKKWILPVFLGLTTIMSGTLQIVVLGMNLAILRILLLCVWARLFMRGEHRGLSFSPMDKSMLALCSLLMITETLLTGAGGFIIGVANHGLETLGTYFLCRILLQNREDMERAVVCLAAICTVLAGFMSVEYLTGRNWLSVLGAVQDYTQVREGRMRCAASFAMPITAGTFGAALLPLFVACWWQGGKLKNWAIPGCLASTVMSLAAGSASSISTYLMAVLGLLMWPLRGHMQTVRRAIVGCLVALQLVMKAPVWALIAHLQIVPGSSSYHRFNLIDSFIRNIDSWWMYGVTSTADWGWFMDDVANQFCIIAKHGGLLGLILFIRVIALGFREVGLTVREVGQDWATGLFSWAFGVMLFAHITAFFGISYFDQTKVSWYLGLAMIASIRLIMQPSTKATDSAPEAAAEVRNDFGLYPGVSQG